MKLLLRFASVVVTALTLLVLHQAHAQERLTLFWPQVMSPGNEKMFTEWGNKVAAESRGAITIDVRANSPLANHGNIIDRVENDVLQIGVSITSIYPGKFELTNVVSLPFTMDLDDVDQEAAAIWRVYKAGVLAPEFQTLVPLFMGVSKQAGFHLAKTPSSIDNLQGLKMRVFNNLQVDMVRALGMSPASIPPADQYQSLQRGTIDGVITVWEAVSNFKLYEIAKYHIELPLGGSVLMAFMTGKKLAALPASARSAIEANSNETFSRAYGRALYEDSIKGKAASSGPDHTIVRLTPDKLNEWRQRFGNDWIQKWKTANGENGEKVFTAFQRAYADVKAGR